MSFTAAIQSALFYFLACTPCNQLHTEHELRQRQKKEKQMRERIVLDQPHLYRQPDPFHTNPYWDEEIRMGPSLPKKRKGSDGIGKSLSQRRLTAASRDGRPSIGTGSSVVVSLSEMGSVASPRPSTSPANAPGIGSTQTVVPEEYPASPTLSKTVSISTSADWNFKRYQREDEELWGHESTWSGHRLMDAIKQAGSSAGRYMESKLGFEKQVTDEDRYNFYTAPRNPPVNDYHPPVVSSRPAHKDALRWMLQPPPPAKVMEGKVPVTRSASMASAASCRRTVSVREGGSLGRLVGEKAVEAKIRRGETPLDDEPRPSPSLRKSRSRVSTATRTRSRRTARTCGSSTDSENDESEDESERRSRRKRRVSHRPPDLDSESEDEGVCVSKSPESLSNTSLSSHAAPKPRLPTILSSGKDNKAASEAGNNGSSQALSETTNPASKPDMVKPNSQPELSSKDLNMGNALDEVSR
ncbi:hypothetical protein MYCTH_2296296 [Thermothelomyces thermophilus ATCC 42464]|uniref:Signal peptide-containing protein n=1 Tax=Thermothelomyces thermophilus (strain ATCC 42464 / BCRC 31852 / DSM 1799) TaxID=573729 RepID=G2Q1D2_THET4|nr:uncharacterized protein MYCTH_2296296 [Thermothelomyces thermophilus ATCC 42464]AEO54122.1 hypothetical protein MYCTH_2296296 [Thermothelomyces thermophilus ATCC 42464]